MSWDFVPPFVLGVAFAVLLVYLKGYRAGHSDGIVQMKDSAVEHGFAQYNPKTGEWEWLQSSTANQ